jgi:branched-chain amino acid transport system ATP-binding protein
VLELSGVRVRFGEFTALDGVSLRVSPGEVVGVVGPNGAGKTTLFNVVCGAVRPVAGSMMWDGRPLRPRPDRLVPLGIARTVQGAGLDSGRTVLANVMAGADTRRRFGLGSSLIALPRPEPAERDVRATALACLHELRIGRYAEELPDEVPLAVRTKALLARALVTRPRLLLLDEPAGSLAGEDLDELADLLRALPARRGGGCAVMLIEHHRNLVNRACDRIVVMDSGRIVTSRPTV